MIRLSLLSLTLHIIVPTTSFVPVNSYNLQNSILKSPSMSLNSLEELRPSERSPTSSPKLSPSKPLRVHRPSGPSKKPVIAVIGRPNVGKSALVNRLAGTQSGGAIVADESGITRDRTYRVGEFMNKKFQIVDTGGLVFDDKEGLFMSQIKEQAMIAISESSAVVLVADGMAGLTSMDLDLAEFLRREVLKRGIPVRVAVNKCESEKTGQASAAEFWKLGLGEPNAVSAIHGVGTAELLEGVFEDIEERENRGKMKVEVSQVDQETEDFLKEYGIGGEDLEDDDGFSQLSKREQRKVARMKNNLDEEYDMDDEMINVAIIGRPNVGKSSILNRIFGSNRAIVSDIAGTTRDSIDAIMERPSEDENVPPTLYRFIDTAGIRKKGKIDFGPEFFMVNRALRAIRRSDVVLLVLDATKGVSEQDRILAQKISDDGRACVIVCNKWDAVVDKDETTYDKSVKYVREELPQVRWAPVLFISAESGQRVGKIYEAVDVAIKAHRKRFTTAVLNEVLRDAVNWQPPPSKRSGASAKIYYCNQVSVRPPTVVVFCSNPELVNDNYKRYIDRKFRESLE
eukprot:CAMPEP_0118671232 /NCGR_PEP_ID=MMETSP0785-20121206/21891_1 /TAXON_ID=91992 /ORGANISM="Bolidomonas pacifica, Strain CCMP 1866" /LENGTH=569 /DNA_ID=CAMNT_0006566101 /DNA_START=185 /DNA_END=1891 /DNA_ORIENTATION=-